MRSMMDVSAKSELGGGCAGVCPGVVNAWGAASPLTPLCPLPLVPPYHLCLPHLKGWLLPLLLSPFVLLTNVAALERISIFLILSVNNQLIIGK